MSFCIVHVLYRPVAFTEHAQTASSGTLTELDILCYIEYPTTCDLT